MKTIIALLIFCALCAAGRAGTDAVLSGIRIVETRDQAHPPRGKLGERGPYQFRRSTWRMHTASSFDLAENREVANVVAKRHYAWIEARLAAHGIDPSPYNVALAWNAGVNGVIRGTAPAVSHDYAARVVNIAESIPDDTPKPQPWQAPILVAEETPPTPTPAKAVPDEAPLVTFTLTPPAQPETYLVSLDLPARGDMLEVRYQSDPILLAFSRSNLL